MFDYFRCTLRTVLEDANIEFSPVLQVSFETFISSDVDVKEAIAQSHASMCHLEEIKNDITTALEPMSLALHVLAFFQLQPSNWFTHILKWCKEDENSVLVSDETPLNNSIEDINRAVLLAVSLIWRICNGSATYEEIVLADSFKLTDIVVQEEKLSLSLFAEIFSDQFNEEVQVCDQLNGVTAFIELQRFSEYVSIVDKVCKQFKFNELWSEWKLQNLMEDTKQFKSKDFLKKISLREAVSKSSDIKERFLIGNDGCFQDVFELFEVVHNSGPFIDFAIKKGFTGITGRQQFTKLYRLVAAQLQHEDYNDVLLDHLLGCFDYVEPFLIEPSSFQQLMEQIISLPSIKNGIKQLKTVNRNVSTIKLWFEVLLQQFYIPACRLSMHMAIIFCLI